MSSLRAAAAAWEAARDRYEEALDEDADAAAVHAARDALGEAEGAVRSAFRSLVERLRGAPEEWELLRELREAVDLRQRIAEEGAAHAELEATHGELAGAGYDERETLERLEAARDALQALSDALLDAASALDAVDD
ncbi:MAG: hypothetical protein D6731_12900 [Planctomycetota bacterium]|nr:MAG: hypothetical protein D6731_12900 [Planctomycetota bacterium]